MTRDVIMPILIFLAILWFVDSVDYWLERTEVHSVPQKAVRL